MTPPRGKVRPRAPYVTAQEQWHAVTATRPHAWTANPENSPKGAPPISLEEAP